MTNAPSPETLISDETKIEIQDYFNRYAAALSGYDSKKLSELWAIPCLIISNGNRASFTDLDTFTTSLEQLNNFYRSLAMKQIQKTVSDISALSTTTLSIKTIDTAYGADGEAIVSWEQSYVLQREEDQWKAIMTIADGEVTTWAAKDTELAEKPASSDNLYLD